MVAGGAPITRYIWTPDKEIGSGIYFVRCLSRSVGTKIGEQTTTKRVVLVR